MYKCYSPFHLWLNKVPEQSVELHWRKRNQPAMKFEPGNRRQKENMHFVKDQLRKPGGSEGAFFSLMVHDHVQCLLLSILSAPLFSPPPLDCDDRLWTTKTNRLMIQFHYGNNLRSVRYIGAHLVVYWRLNQPTLVGLFLCMVWKSRCAANLALLALFGPN
jgi:hypothetical protein